MSCFMSVSFAFFVAFVHNHLQNPSWSMMARTEIHFKYTWQVQLQNNTSAMVQNCKRVAMEFLDERMEITVEYLLFQRHLLSWMRTRSAEILTNLSKIYLPLGQSETACWERTRYVGKHKKKKKTGEKYCAKKLGCNSPSCRTTDLTALAHLQLGPQHICLIETQVSNNLLRVAESLASLQTCVLIVRSVVEWKQRAGLRCTTCPKCLCEGDALGRSHSLLRDCSCTLKSPFCIMVKEAPALKLAALQQVRSGFAEVETLKDAWRGKGCE